VRRFLRRPRRRGPRVLDVGGPILVEGSDELSARHRGRIAVVAHWSNTARLSRSVLATAAALAAADYAIVLVSTAEVPEPLDWQSARPVGVTVLRRPNVGYDFGSWAAAIDRYPQLVEAERILLMNDSLAGPFAPVAGLLERFHASTADAWGITDTTQFGQHLQSYALGFPGRSLAEGPIRQFWRDIRVEPTKDELIWQNEIGLSNMLRRERFVIDVAIPSWRVVEDGRNPTIIGWRRLLDRGFPFIKRELLRHPQLAPDGFEVRGEIRRRFGVDVDEWT